MAGSGWGVAVLLLVGRLWGSGSVCSVRSVVAHAHVDRNALYATLPLTVVVGAETAII